MRAIFLAAVLLTVVTGCRGKLSKEDAKSIIESALAKDPKGAIYCKVEEPVEEHALGTIEFDGSPASYEACAPELVRNHLIAPAEGQGRYVLSPPARLSASASYIEFPCGKIVVDIGSIATEEKTATVEYIARVELNAEQPSFSHCRVSPRTATTAVQRAVVARDDEGTWTARMF